jgi:hypothetical protein
MDGMNPEPHSSERRVLTQVISDGLILWRLSSSGQADLWGMIFELPDGFNFVVDDDPQGPKPSRIHERHTDVISLVHRAETLKGSLVARGWVDVDVE